MIPSLRGALATKQSIYPLCRGMDCFVSLAMTVSLHLPRRQILDPHAVAIPDDLGDPLPVAVGVLALVAEIAYRSRFFHQLRQLVELLFGLRGLQMPRIDP